MDDINYVDGGVHDASKELQKFVEKQLKGIKSSEVFVSLFTENYEKSPLCLLQLTLAIALNKPIYLLIAEGMMPSPKLMKVVDKWEFFERNNPNSIKEATSKLLKEVK
jgi:hypothetical protein